MSAKNTGIVRFTLDPKNPPRLLDKESRRLLALRDEDIDLSDIPETTGVPWTRPGRLVPAENKQQISLRIDADVLNFYRATGRRYQTRINEVLRLYMEAQAATTKSRSRRRAD